MKQIILRLMIALLTFSIGLTASFSYHAAVSRDEANLLISKESKLRGELFRMRQLLDRYTSEQGQNADSLEGLVKAGYMSEIPIDPMTGQRTWKEDHFELVGIFYIPGIINVRCLSNVISSEGTKYSEW